MLGRPFQTVGPGARRGLLLVALLLGVLVVDQWGFRWWRAPWSYEAVGPTLTGSWEGPLRAHQGAEYRLLLSLGYQYHDQHLLWGESNLTGAAWLCTPRGEVHEYAVDGHASRSGDAVEIDLAYGDPRLSGLGFDLVGSWDGQVLTLRPSENPFQPDGSFQASRTVSTSDPDDSFGTAELRKSDRASFLVACGRLTR